MLSQHLNGQLIAMKQFITQSRSVIGAAANLKSSGHSVSSKSNHQRQSKSQSTSATNNAALQSAIKAIKENDKQ